LIEGTINSDYELINDVEWVLDGEVVVGAGNVAVTAAADVQAIKDAGVTLMIEAGTEVKALDDGSLLVTRGSKLMANGSDTAPITFSSIDSDLNGYGMKKTITAVLFAMFVLLKAVRLLALTMKLTV